MQHTFADCSGYIGYHLQAFSLPGIVIIIGIMRFYFNADSRNFVFFFYFLVYVNKMRLSLSSLLAFLTYLQLRNGDR